MDRYIVKLTVAPSGTGKTWRRAAKFIVDEWIPFGGGTHWSNFPLRLDPYLNGEGRQCEGLVEYAAKRWGKDREEIRQRVKTIPQEEMRAWMEGTSGPWEFFKDKDLSGAHIAIDEAHSFFPHARAAGGPEFVDKCMHWISEIRHEGATVEFLTQHQEQLSEKIRNACAAELVLVNLQDVPLPLVNIRLGDVMDLLACFNGGKYHTWVRQDEFKQNGKGPKTRLSSNTHWMDPKYFEFYDSFSASNKGGKTGRSMERMYVRLGRWGTVKWFLFTHWFRPTVLAMFVGWIVWFLLSGGIPKLYFSVVGSMGLPTGEAAAAKSADVDRKEAPPIAQRKPDGGIRAELEKVAGRMEDSEVRLLAELMAELQDARAELEEVQAERDEAKERADAFGLEGLSVVGRDFVVFTDGSRYRRGEVIRHGDFKDDVVAAINWKDSSVTLRSGHVIRMQTSWNGRGKVSLGEVGTAVRTNVRRSLSGGRGDGSEPVSGSRGDMERAGGSTQ